MICPSVVIRCGLSVEVGREGSEHGRRDKKGEREGARKGVGVYAGW
jgi:hypothetical protein